MTLRIACAVLAGLLTAAAPGSAHHSFTAEFDPSKPVSLAGSVTSLEWTNPHIWVNLDVKGASGVQRWRCEGGSASSLRRNGWTRTSLKPGDQVQIDGFLARLDATTCNIRTIKTASGQTLFSGGAPAGAGQ